MKNIKKLIVAATLLAVSGTCYAQSWGVSTQMGSFGYSNSKRGGQQWGFSAGGIGFGYSSSGGPIGIGGGGGWGGGGGGWGGGGGVAVGGGGGVALPAGGYCGGAPYGAVFYPNAAPPGVFGGYGPGPSRGYVRRNPPTGFTSGWVTYPNVW